MLKTVSGFKTTHHLPPPPRFSSFFSSSLGKYPFFTLSCQLIHCRYLSGQPGRARGHSLHLSRAPSRLIHSLGNLTLSYLDLTKHASLYRVFLSCRCCTHRRVGCAVPPWHRQ